MYWQKRKIHALKGEMWRKYAKIVIFVFLEQRCSNCVLKLRFVHFYKMHINREQVRCAKIISACVNARHMDTRHVFLIWHILMTLYFGDTDLVDNELCWQKMHLKDTSNYAVNLKFHYCAWQTRQILIIARGHTLIICTSKYSEYFSDINTI